jgi:molybdopterin/thiamine biosynthesis adenylyltransferase
MKLEHFLRSHARDGLVPWPAQSEAAEKFGLSYGAVEEAALEMNLLPARYQRNRQSITTRRQLRLFRAKVAVIGCGGLGGYVVEELARLGAGQLTVIDPDVFEEHNLNRQVLATFTVLGKAKVETAAERVKEINPAVTVIPVKRAFTKENGPELLKGMDVVVDALDSISVRLELAEVCKSLNIPLVHGSIGGWYGQVTTQFPGEDALEKLYPKHAAKKGIETELGNLSFTAGFVAAIEAAEVCKILVGEGTPLRRRMLTINLLDMEIVEIQL